MGELRKRLLRERLQRRHYNGVGPKEQLPRVTITILALQSLLENYGLEPLFGNNFPGNSELIFRLPKMLSRAGLCDHVGVGCFVKRLQRRHYNGVHLFGLLGGADYPLRPSERWVGPRNNFHGLHYHFSSAELAGKLWTRAFVWEQLSGQLRAHLSVTEDAQQSWSLRSRRSVALCSPWNNFQGLIKTFKLCRACSTSWTRAGKIRSQAVKERLLREAIMIAYPGTTSRGSLAH
jgi:hypothetical protein